MDSSHKPDFVKLLIGMAQIYGKEINEFIFEAFWIVLKEFELQIVKKAFVTYLGNTYNGQFMPKPADIKRIIIGNEKEKAHDAWHEFDFALRCYGPYATIQFQNKLTGLIIKKMGGLLRFANVNNAEYQCLKKDFLELYCRYNQEPEFINNQPITLIGIGQANNSSLNYSTARIVYIEDQANHIAENNEDENHQHLIAINSTTNKK